MKRLMILALTALFLGTADVSAQTIIKGVVKDSISGESEPYATVRVFKVTDMEKAVAMSLTDIDGKIKQEVTGTGEHVVTIASMGKMDIRRTVNLNGQREIDLGTVLVSDDSKTLAGVEVVAHKPLVKMETDKMSYNVENDADSKTQTLLDMLRKVPMVTVDAQDNITVNGSSSFKVYVDGKPNPMMSSNPSQIFKSIPASIVKNIEVVTNPGARYDAEGASGVLNIVMQYDGVGGGGMSGINGYSGTITGAYAGPRGIGGGAFINAQLGKWSVNFDAYYNYNRLDDMEIEMTREQMSELGTSTMQYKQKSNTKVPFTMSNIGIGYEIDSLSSINASFGFTHYNTKLNGHPITTMSGGIYGDGYSYGNIMRQENKSQDFTGTLDYQRFFNAERTSQMVISYQFDYSPGHTKNWSEFDPVEGSIPLDLTDRYSDNSQKTIEHTLQVDITTPIAQQQTLNYGAKYVNRHNDADSKYYLSDVYNEAMSSDYRYMNNIGAVYAEYDGHWGKWGTKAGLRYEHTWQKVEYRLGNGSDFSKDYGTLVPSATLSYSFSPTQNLGLSYNMRISRPGISYLNPYVDRSNPTMLNYGNSNLDVEKSHNINLVFNSFSSKWMMSATLRHSFCDNGIEQYSFFDNATNLLNTTYGNVVKRHTTSLNFYANWSAFRDTRLMFNGGVSYSDMRSEALDLKNNGWSYNMMVNVQQKLPWDIQSSLFWMTNSKSYTLQGWSTGFNILGLNLSKDIIKDKLTVGVMALTGLDKGGKIIMDTKSRGKDFVNTQRIHVPIQQFSIEITYNFGNLKQQITRRQSKVNNDYIEERNAGEQLNNIGGMGGGMGM